jgi:hypothetical protein
VKEREVYVCTCTQSAVSLSGWEKSHDQFRSSTNNLKISHAFAFFFFCLKNSCVVLLYHTLK